MKERLSLQVRTSSAGLGLILAAAAALGFGAGCSYLPATSDAGRSKDNQNSSKATTGSTSSFTKVKKDGKNIAALMYGVSSDPAHAEAAAGFLRANATQLRQDLAFGAGPAIDDLAWIGEIRPEHEREFARLLAQHRRELLEAADVGQLTPARAAACFARIGELIAGHPVLEQDRLAWLARHLDSAG
jgi:hypothetical protein